MARTMNITQSMSVFQIPRKRPIAKRAGDNAQNQDISLNRSFISSYQLSEPSSGMGKVLGGGRAYGLSHLVCMRLP